MADAKVKEAAKKAARLNVRPDLGAGYFTDERETWAMGYVAGAAAEREAILREMKEVQQRERDAVPDDKHDSQYVLNELILIVARREP